MIQMRIILCKSYIFDLVGAYIFHKLLIAIHVLPAFPVLELILFSLDVLLVLPFPEDFVDDEEEGDDNDCGGVEG